MGFQTPNVELQQLIEDIVSAIKLLKYIYIHIYIYIQKGNISLKDPEYDNNDKKRSELNAFL